MAAGPSSNLAPRELMAAALVKTAPITAQAARHERVYLRAYESVSQAKADIAQYIERYNAERGHTSFDGQHTPCQANWRFLPRQELAA